MNLGKVSHWIDDLFDDSEKVELAVWVLPYWQMRILNTTMTEEEKNDLLEEIEEPLTKERLNEINLRLVQSQDRSEPIKYNQKGISNHLRWIQKS